MKASENLFDLNGQVALITGAAKGLGLAMAQTFAAQGASIVLADVDASSCEQAAVKLRAEGAEAIAFCCDVSNPTDIARLIESSLAWRGHVDTLVCNAGIQGPAGPLTNADDSDWQKVFDINLRAAVRLVQGLVPGMAERGAGSVILMSSIAGLRGNKSIGLYGLTKAAVAQLARNLAVEWGPSGVRVNAISPGLIRTPLSAGLMNDEAFMQRRMSITPLRRVGEPHEVAGVAAMLASRAGAFITGQNLVVDGGTLISDGS